MRQRQFRPSATRQVLIALLITSLFYGPLLALQPKSAKAAAPKPALHERNFAPPATIFAEAWRTFTGLFQSGVNLDTLRSATPQPPNAYQPLALPPASYDDPKPVNTANYDTYLTTAVQPQNATGPVGALPLQAPDPTVSNSATGGLSIDLLERRFNFGAPVLNLAGRAGLNLGPVLSYSSNSLWQGNVFNLDRGFPAPGWRLGFGAILVRDPVNGSYYNSVTQQQSLIYLAPDGTRHDLRAAGSGVYESYDGSYLQFNVSSQVLSFPNGTQMLFGAYSYSTNNYDYLALPVKLTDRQGNFITIAYKTLTYAANNEKQVLDYVTDTAGRRIDFEYTNNRLTAVKQQRGGNWFYFARLDYAPVTLQTSFATTDPPLPNGTQVWMLNRITYPTGASLRFGFNGYGQISSVAKWAPGVNGQGGERQVATTTFGYDTAYAPTRLITRTEAAENWTGLTYGYSVPVTGTGYVNDLTERIYKATLNGLTYELVTYGYQNPDVSLKRTITTYQQDAGVSYRANPRPVLSEIWDSSSGGSTTIRKASTEYQQFYGMWLPTRQYDQPDGSGGSYRYTETTYTHYPAQRILGLPAQVSVYKGNGALLSRVQNNYDETGSYTDSNNQVAPYLIDESSAGVIQHEASYNVSYITRGNLTSVTQFAVVNGAVTGSRVVKRANYDTNGNLRGEADAAGHRKQIVYTDNYSNKPAGVGATQVYPYTTATPELSAMLGGAQHEYYTGNVLKTFNLAPGSGTELQTATTSYDFADRPLLTTKPDGGWARTDYWDNLLAVGTAQQIESGKVRFKWELLDGAGHVFKNASDHPDGVTGKYAGQLFAYDKFGRVKDSSNVLAVGGAFTPGYEDSSASWLFTQMSYDTFSRLVMAKKPDNNEVHVDYEGCGCAGQMTKRVTDELGNYTETKTDLYGRLAEAVEPGQVPANGHYSKAVYSYDELDRLVQITHTAAYDWTYQVTPAQTRTFSYDGYGRQASETTPEAGTVSYGYKVNDLLDWVTNANGKTASYNYDKRNLTTSVGFSDTTPGVSYLYDTYGARTQMTDGAGQVSYAYNGFRQLQSETRTFTELTGNSYLLSYSYNQADQVQSVNYRSTMGYNPGAPLSYNHIGQTQAPPYSLSGTVTNAQGQPVGGATITLSGAASGQKTTDPDGTFIFKNLTGGTYTLTPTLAGYVFNPSSITYNSLQKSWTNANFTALPPQQTTFDKNVNYAYNTVGALSGVGTNLIGTDANNTTNVINGLQFKAFGAIRQLNYGNGLQLTMGYNANRQQPVTMKVGPNGTGSIVDYTYEYYDATGHNNNRIRSITDGVDGQYSVSYTYDKWNRLTHATAGAYSRYYQYDAFGNLRTAIGTGGPNPTYTLNYAQNATTAPATNRILNVVENGQMQQFGYDNAGNLTAGDGMTYAYDAANRMTSVNNGALGQYGYDGEGMRVKKVESGQTVWYVRSSKLGQVALEVTSVGMQRAYVYASGGKLLAEHATDGQFYWVHTNHLNNAQAMTSTGGGLSYKGQFDPHGQVLTEWSATGNPELNSKKFTGYERDTATGLDYANARTYASRHGRFMKPDPMGLNAADLKKPQSLNRYAYVENDPVNFIDPSGKLRAYSVGLCTIANIPSYYDGGGSSWFVSCPSTGGGGSDNDEGLSSGGGNIDDIGETAEEWQLKNNLANALRQLDESCQKALFGGKEAAYDLANKSLGWATGITIAKSGGTYMNKYIPGRGMIIGTTFQGYFDTQVEKYGALGFYAATVAFNFSAGNTDAGVYKSFVINSSTFDRLSPDAQQKILVHEYYHVYSNRTDSGIFRDLKLGEKGYSGDASIAFSDWLKDGCPQKKPGSGPTD